MKSASTRCTRSRLGRASLRMPAAVAVRNASHRVASLNIPGSGVTPTRAKSPGVDAAISNGSGSGRAQ